MKRKAAVKSLVVLWDVVDRVWAASSEKPKTHVYWADSKALAEGCARIASRCTEDVSGATRWTVTLKNGAKIRFRGCNDASNSSY